MDQEHVLHGVLLRVMSWLDEGGCRFSTPPVKMVRPWSLFAGWVAAGRYRSGLVRLLVARCEIAYHGRAPTRLARGDRVILFKDDGSLCVHADRGYKPLNYMAGPTSVTQDSDVIRVYRPASDETLVIMLLDVVEDSLLDLRDEAVLEHDGAERQIHVLLERA